MRVAPPMLARSFFFALLLFGGCHLPSATVPARDATLAHWTGRANQVRLGMRREEVERLLPPYVFTPGKSEPGPWGYASSTISGGAQAVSYYVAPRFRVTIFYDYTGAERDAGIVSTRHASPDNRVVQLPTVTLEPASAAANK